MLSICNHDCFNCKLPDCSANDAPTPKENEIMRGAHRDWDMEIKVKNFETLLHSGMRVRDVTAFLGLSYREVKAIQRRRKIRDRKITQRKKPLQTAI